MFCPNCGSELKNGVKYCTECGVELAKYTDSGNDTEAGNDAADSSPSDAAHEGACAAEPRAATCNMADPASDEVSEGQKDEAASGGAKRAGVAALLASTVQIAGVAVPAFALVAAGAAAAGAIAFALASGSGTIRPARDQVSQENSITDDANQKARESYATVIDEFRSFNRGSYDVSVHPHMRDLELWSDPSLWETVQYAFADINGNGLDELLLGFNLDVTPSDFLCAAYTYSDGDARLLFCSGVHKRIRLCEGAVLFDEGDPKKVALYRVSEKGDLEEIESMAIDYDRAAKRALGTHTVNGSIVEQTEDSWSSSSSSSTPNANRIIDEIMARNPFRSDLNWTDVES